MSILEQLRVPPEPGDNSDKILTYGMTAWRRSSQIAANLYHQDVKLWTRENLRHMEAQLAQSDILAVFTIRSFDGKVVSIKNPNHGQRSPIWKPYVKYQEYWRLVKSQPDGPPETYRCTYLVEWSNRTARDFRRIVPDAQSLFDRNLRLWAGSASSGHLQTQLREHLGVRRVTKLLCFGLGDFCREPPEWYMRQMKDIEETTTVANAFVRESMLQHAVALTMVEVCRALHGEDDVQLLTQDPDYTDQARELLIEKGFLIVGNFGAGGFADISDDSIVFSAFVEAPLKQIIADIARPAIIITTEFAVFNDSEKPWADADSPRTQEMWQSYDRYPFPVSPDDEESMIKMQGLYMYVRKLE